MDGSEAVHSADCERLPNGQFGPGNPGKRREKVLKTPQEMLDALLDQRDRMALGKTVKGHWGALEAAIEDYRGRVSGASDGETVAVADVVEAVLASIREEEC
jgi:hypothetical protein